MTTFQKSVKERLGTLTLEQVSYLYGQGNITRAEAEEYARQWNAGPRHTRATVYNNCIMNK